MHAAACPLVEIASNTPRVTNQRIYIEEHYFGGWFGLSRLQQYDAQLQNKNAESDWALSCHHDHWRGWSWERFGHIAASS